MHTPDIEPDPDIFHDAEYSAPFPVHRVLKQEDGDGFVYQVFLANGILKRG